MENKRGIEHGTSKMLAPAVKEAIRGSKGALDPRGSRALMHTAEMWKNGKLYRLEVLYDKATNAIWHFKYSPIK